MADQLNPGYYRIIKAELSSYDGEKTHDIRYMIHDITISEGMSKSSMRGHITIADSANLIDEYPIRGEEKLLLKYEDPFKNEVELSFQVYAVTGVDISTQGSVLVYKLHIVSESRARSESALISRSYAGRISDMVREIHSEYFGTDKEIDIEETVGEYKIIIPKLSPDQAIRFLARRAYSEENTSQSFQFFETKERFYFATYEYVMQKEKDLEPRFDGLDRLKIYSFDPYYDGAGDGLLKMMSAAISITPVDRVDTVKYSGRNPYRKVTTEIDLIQRSLIPTSFSYQDAFKSYAKNFGENPTPKNTDSFISDRFSDNEDTMYVIRDYSDQIQGLYTGSVPATGEIDQTVSEVEVPSGYKDAVKKQESGGNPNAQSSTSTAAGYYGFTVPTWNGLVKNYPGRGLTYDGRMDPAQQEIAMDLLTAENERYLSSRGIAITDSNLYAAHFLGQSGAAKVLKSPENTPLRSLLSPEAIKANSFLKDWNVSQFVNWTNDKVGSGGGKRVIVAGDVLPYQGTSDLGLRSNTFYPEIMNNKTAFFQHINDSPVKMMVYGRNDITPGNLVKLNIPEFRYKPGEQRTNNKTLSGMYIIAEVESYFFREEYKQELTLQKLDWNEDSLYA